MKPFKFDFNKCSKLEKAILGDQICYFKCVWSNKCSIDMKECEALIK